jgi:hypothetical protein
LGVTSVAPATHPLAQFQRAAVEVARTQEDVLARTDLPRVYLHFVPLSLAVGLAMMASFFLSSTLVPVLSVWLRRTSSGRTWDGWSAAWIRQSRGLEHLHAAPR